MTKSIYEQWLDELMGPCGSRRKKEKKELPKVEMEDGIPILTAEIAKDPGLYALFREKYGVAYVSKEAEPYLDL